MKTLKTLGIFFIALFLMKTANAQSLKTDKTEVNFSVKYIGTEGEYLCFQVEFTSAADYNTVLKISDRTEGELYTQNWKAKAPQQIFKIEKRDGQQLVFNLQNGGKATTKVFSTSTKLVENTTVVENAVASL